MGVGVGGAGGGCAIECLNINCPEVESYLLYSLLLAAANISGQYKQLTGHHKTANLRYTEVTHHGSTTC